MRFEVCAIFETGKTKRWANLFFDNSKPFNFLKKIELIN